MRHLLFLIIILFNAVLLSAQAPQTNSGQLSTNGKVYAVVVGISAYENTGIPPLSFAHKDAEVFNEYLTSKAGGSVPAENIRMLLNENATYAAIYDALGWLLQTCKENDLVYFYFSGHGDMENATIYKLGFLLSYNSPRSNYINSAVRIEDLNNFANTLSVKAKARVVLIMDACHAGKLAGTDFRGSFLVGEQLRAVKDNEIRLTSCAPDQLSAEDEGWGGGRGVFSYYLIHGMQGQADKVKDGNVTLNEIQNYLDSAMANDGLLAQKGHLQKPSITGNRNFTISLVAKNVSQEANVPMLSLAPSNFLKPLEKTAQSYLFDVLQSQIMEEVCDFNLLNTYPAEDIPFAFLTLLKDSVKNLVPAGRLEELKQALQKNPDALKRFTNKLVVMLSDRGQKVINDYLNGDEAELERRRYYNSLSNNYDDYPAMFSVASKLAQPGSYLAGILQVKYHYFAGIATRLKTPLVKDPAPLVEKALKSQLKAYELEENAAYIHNELGNLYNAKNEWQKAEKFFVRATQIAPTWSIPWANLSGLYLQRNQKEKAMDAVKKALALQPGYQGNFINLGLIYEQQNNLLFAEEYFRTSIELNTRHYLPFERLAYTYMRTTDYALADSFFYEAEKRKQGFHFSSPMHMKLPKVLSEVSMPDFLCDFDTAHIKPGDVLANFAWAMLSSFRGNFVQAESKFRNSIKADSANPLAWHYLGKLLYDQQRWMEADVAFNHALTSHLEKENFDLYVKKLSDKMHPGPSSACFRQMFEAYYYDAVHDRYFLASLYEKWGYFTSAEMHYRKIIQSDSSFPGGYQMLWTLLEKMGRYPDAEAVIKQLQFVDKRRGRPALLAFYKRMIAKFPEDKWAYYNAANFLFSLVSESPDSYIHDRKIILPDTDEEVLEHGFHHPGFAHPIKLPGTNEQIIPAPAINAPYSDGISFFLIADSLFDEVEMRAEINQKTGDLYVWQGLAKKSLPHYTKSVRLQPTNADTRMKLIRASALNYKLSGALAELDSLRSRKQINFEMQMLMAKFTSHAARFGDASVLISELEKIYPYENNAAVELEARLNFLRQRPREAQIYYKKLLAVHPREPQILYSLAVVNAQMQNEAPAISYLKQAIENGFNFNWVVKEDNNWKLYRNNLKWKSAVKTMKAKTYE